MRVRACACACVRVRVCPCVRVFDRVCVCVGYQSIAAVGCESIKDVGWVDQEIGIKAILDGQHARGGGTLDTSTH